jgi:hypothetical protein
VERRLERLLQRPVVLSPRDWRVLAGWHARGVPLAVVLEAMDEVAAKKRGAPPRALSYFVRAVEESWRAVQEGRALRVGEAGRDAPGKAAEPVAPWTSALASGRLPGPLARTVTEMVARLRAGEDPRSIDDDLDRALCSGETAPEAFARARQEALEALSAYEHRMTRDAWTRTLARAVSDRMREALGLPRIGPVRRVV